MSVLARTVGCALALLAGTGPLRAAVVINEVMYNSLEANDVEYVEIYNDGPSPQVLTNWYLQDVDSTHDKCFLSGTLAPGAYLVVAGLRTLFQAKYPGVTNLHANQFDSTVVGSGWALGNGGDRVRLFDNIGVLVDFVEYDDLPPWPTAANGGGPSLELIRPGLDNTLATSWGASTTVPQEGTPGAINSVYTPDQLPILELLARSVPLPTTADTVAVTVRVTDDVGLLGVELRVDSGAGFTPQPMFDDGLHGDGPANNTIYGALVSPRPNGTLVRYYAVGRDSANQTQNLPPAAPADYHAYTVGFKPAALEVHEILASNATGIVDEFGQVEDWLELRNRDTVPINLGGMFLSDQAEQSRKWMLPATVLAPGGYLVVWCDNDEPQGPLHTSFKLEKAGGSISLFDTVDHGNTLIHGFKYGLQNTDVSFGYLPDDADAPDYLNGPTPGLGNGSSTLFSPVLITELQTTSSAGGTDDYVELLNRSAVPVDLSGWHVTDEVDTPAKYTFPPGSVLPAGGLLLVNETQLGFAFSSSGIEVVQLSAPDALTGMDYFDYGPQTADVTQGRYPQGSGNWHFFSPGSLGMANTCAQGATLPAVTGLLFTAKNALAWTAVAAAQDYDLIRGDLLALRATGGNFAASSAVCAENDSRDTRSFAPQTPAAGGGHYWVVRAATFACGYGTWNSSSARQVGTRDPELGGAGGTCP